MEANAIIEINLVLDDKQNAEITTIIAKWVSYFQCNLLHKTVDQKKKQINTVSFNVHVLSSIVTSTLYIKYNKSHRS